MAVEISAPPDGRRGEMYLRRFLIKDDDRLIYDPHEQCYKLFRGGKTLVKRRAWEGLIQVRIGETMSIPITEITAHAEEALIMVNDGCHCQAQITITNGAPALHAFGGVDIEATHALVK